MRGPPGDRTGGRAPPLERLFDQFGGPKKSENAAAEETGGGRREQRSQQPSRQQCGGQSA